jgi:hypothetical protein
MEGLVTNKYSPSDFEASGDQSAVSVSAENVFVQKANTAPERNVKFVIFLN